MEHKGTVRLETERLVIREFDEKDTTTLYEIMKKSRVMHAWEHGFTFEETREWLARQQERYRRDGFGYFAVLQKPSASLIGQAGLIASDIEGKSVTEIGYVFDDSVWGNGYATEAARALVEFAFGTLGVDELYCTMRPENLSSVKVAQRLGFEYSGEYIKVYKGKEMPHGILILKRYGT